MEVVDTKQCSKCKKTLPVTDFVRRKFSPSGNWGYTSHCKPCRNAKSKADWADGKIRDKIYQRKFGINLQQYEQMLDEQGGKCAICGTDKPMGHGAKYGRLSVDHCHTTGIVRGLLCHQCNVTIGSAKDDITILANAIAYLEKFK